MKKIALFVAAALLSAGAMAHSTPTKLATDSVFNGSFESNYVWTGTVGLGNVASPWKTTGLTGVADGVLLTHAADGKSYAFLTSTTVPFFGTTTASISQSFTASTAGAYDFTFDLAGGSTFFSGQTFQVLVDGKTIGSYALTSSWTAELATATLGIGTHTLSFLETAKGFIGASTALLDNVKISAVSSPVSAVPEADTYAMMLAGLGLVGFIARRRKAA